MPMPSGTLYSFGKAVNIRFMHAINAIAPEEQSNEGRISIILWGLSRMTIDEPNEPAILETNDRRSKSNNFEKGGRFRRSGQHRQALHAAQQVSQKTPRSRDRASDL